jgi:riboflavin kinase/FMN adenylyltransferase
MNVWNDIKSYPADRTPKGLPSLLVTFEPHPLSVVAPDRRPALLQTRRQKLDCLEQTGLTDVAIVAFDQATAQLDGDGFFAEILDPYLKFAAVHVGRNFRFGRDRGGNLESLAKIGESRGFEVSGTPQIRLDDQTVSSTLIRSRVTEGDVAGARRMLGRPFALTGEVVRGAGRGTRLLIPTANLEAENEIGPAPGVYVTETLALASRFPSVTNVGFRPTFDGKLLTIESHLIDFEGDLYGERIEVRLLERIRDEMRFADSAELADQIARDRAAAESYFHNIQLQSG